MVSQVETNKQAKRCKNTQSASSNTHIVQTMQGELFVSNDRRVANRNCSQNRMHARVHTWTMQASRILPTHDTMFPKSACNSDPSECSAFAACSTSHSGSRMASNKALFNWSSSSGTAGNSTCLCEVCFCSGVVTVAAVPPV